MAKKSKFWDENKLTLIPCIICFVALGMIGGTYFGLDKYATAKHERNQAAAAKAALDTAQQVKDTIALPAAQKQK